MVFPVPIFLILNNNNNNPPLVYRLDNKSSITRLIQYRISHRHSTYTPAAIRSALRTLQIIFCYCYPNSYYPNEYFAKNVSRHEGRRSGGLRLRVFPDHNVPLPKSTLWSGGNPGSVSFCLGRRRLSLAGCQGLGFQSRQTQLSVTVGPKFLASSHHHEAANANAA
jgi:hypothetical protein